MATPNIVPRADSEGGLGTASKYWGSAYIDTIYVGAGKVGRDANNNIDFSTDNSIIFKTNNSNRLRLDQSQFYPVSNDGLSLGTATTAFSDLFLATGAVINFNNGNVTLTHSSNALTLADGDYMQFGSSGDLQIYHSGASSAVNNTTGHLYISNGADGSDIIFQCDDGSGGVATYLTLDGGEGHMIASKELNFADSVAATFGNKAGGDLEIKEQSGNSYISNFTGNLEITQNADDSAIIFKCDDGSGGTTEYFKIDGNTQYMLASKNIRFLDGKSVKLGTAGDAAIQHDGTDTLIENYTGDLTIKNLANDKDIKFQCDNGDSNLATYFFLDGSSATHSGSATTGLYTNWPDYSRISLGTSHDLQIYHDSTNSNIINAVGNLAIQNNADDGDIKFFCDDGSGGVAEYFRVDGSSALTYFSKHIQLADGQNAYFGGGADLAIKHDGSTSAFIHNSIGDLYIKNDEADHDIYFQCDDGSGGLTNYLILDGGVTKTIFSQHALFSDGIEAHFGTGVDLKIYHSGTNSFIENQTGSLVIRNNTDDGDIIFQSDDGSGGVETYFYLDGSSGGGEPFTVFPDYANLVFGDGHDLRIFHNSANSYIENKVGNLEIKNDADDGDIIFKSDDGSGGTTAYLTLDGGSSKIIVGKQIEIQGDNRKLTLGASADLEIYHDGTDSRVYNATGDFVFRNSQDDGDVKFQCDDGSGGVTTYITLDGGDVSTIVSTIKVMMPNLPTSNPSTAGQLWNDSGTLKISAG